MPRRARSFKRRTPAPDPKFASTRYGKFVNYLMERGKKTVAVNIFYKAIEEVESRVAKDPSLVALSRAEEAQQAVKAKAKKTVTVSAGADEPESVKKLTGRDIFDIALKNVCPALEVKGRRIGGSNYQVPMEVMEPRKTTLGMKWMIGSARARKGMPMYKKLASEILDAYNRQGGAFKKMEDVQRMAAANRAFAHFARFGQKRK